MRLIDADELKKHIMYTASLGGWLGETIEEIKKLAIKYIDLVPTIDAVEVVRCKDCIEAESEPYSRLLCKASGRLVDNDDYCSWGRRRVRNE